MFVFLLVFMLFDVKFCNINIASAESENIVYAKALENCVLYKSQTLDDDLNNIYFIVPETYFVVVLSNVDDLICKVQYDKYIGYVKSNSILVATFVPIVKTLEDIKCDIKQTSGTQIWNKPSAFGDVLTTIPAGMKDINYIASVYGDIPNGGESNIWFYISYTPATNSTNVYEGYIYSENTTNLSEIVVNAETNPEVIELENNIVDNTINISSTFKTILIALISIPIILLFAIILYKLIKKFKQNTNKDNFNDISFFDETKNINNTKENNFKNQALSRNNLYDNELKNQIGRMKQTSYVRKQGNINYPQFPIYDSEDDLL